MSEFAMFSDAGNQLVMVIYLDTVQLKIQGAFETDTQLWQYAYSRLDQLHRDPVYAEATDTEVRETLWNQLVDAEMFTNWRQVDYWFYVDWITTSPEMFKLTVDTYTSTC